MIRPRSKNQVFFFLFVTALVVLAIYLLHVFEPSLESSFLHGTYASPQAEAQARESFVMVMKIVRLVLWMVLAVMIVRALAAFIFGVFFRLRKGYEAPILIRNIFSVIGYIAAFVIIFKYLYPTVGLGALFTTSAVLGAIIGLALQDTLGNFFAGISLHADKPFQVGDVVTVGQKTGVVESITWRAVKIRTFTNHIVLTSHSSVSKESIEVCPRDNLNARIVFFNTLYTDSPAKTIHIVREAVREADNVSPKITPIVRIRSLAESGVDWEVKYWLTDYAKHNDTDALVRQRIWYAFRRAGINFAFPTRTLHVERKTKADAAQADGSGFIERLSAVDIFAPLSQEETARLAGASVSHVFAPGEIVIRAGDEGSSMFVVHQGRVSVQISDNGKPRTVAVLKDGDFFGEMALFTGEPRAANVVALEETEVLEIGHQAMKHLFETNPDLVDSLSHIIAERRVGLTAKPEDSGNGKVESEGIMAAIKRFFGFD
ncbi:MAG TPA: mechanosensitive ion channel family protein [Pyrinomonadaceae bacterium]|nr:mechanosensitive ion channel family protein [Pyrinomonadaceae bacterium]